MATSLGRMEVGEDETLWRQWLRMKDEARECLKEDREGHILSIVNDAEGEVGCSTGEAAWKAIKRLRGERIQGRRVAKDDMGAWMDSDEDIVRAFTEHEASEDHRRKRVDGR